MKQRFVLKNFQLANRTLKSLNLLCILLIAGCLSSKAQEDPYKRLERAASKSDTQRTVLSKVKISSDNPKWKSNTKSAIIFKPFELVDNNGKKIPPGQTITLPSGKQITAKEYEEQLNEIEQKLNASG